MVRHNPWAKENVSMAKKHNPIIKKTKKKRSLDPKAGEIPVPIVRPIVFQYKCGTAFFITMLLMYFIGQFMLIWA